MKLTLALTDDAKCCDQHRKPRVSLSSRGEFADVYFSMWGAGETNQDAIVEASKSRGGNILMHPGEELGAWVGASRWGVSEMKENGTPKKKEERFGGILALHGSAFRWAFRVDLLARIDPIIDALNPGARPVNVRC